MSGKADAPKPRKLGRGLSSLMQIEVPVEVTPRYEQNTNINTQASPGPEASAAVAAVTPAAPAVVVPAITSAGPAQALPVARPAPAVAPGAAAPASMSGSIGVVHAAARPTPEAVGGLRYVPVSSIDPNRYQPRRVFDVEQIRSLSESIRRAGLMQPVVVRPAAGGRFELVAGERRWRAASQAGLSSIPAIVRDLSDQDAAEWAVVENVQRTDLNPIERAEAFRALSDRFGLTHAQIGERVGIDRSSVANLIRLTELESEIQEMIALSTLSAGHGKALLAMPAGAKRLALAKLAAEQGWSVRQLEARTGEADVGTPSASKPETTASAGVRDLEKRLGEFLGTKIQLRTNSKGTRGKLVIEFYGLDHFDGLMSRIGFRES